MFAALLVWAGCEQSEDDRRRQPPPAPQAAGQDWVQNVRAAAAPSDTESARRNEPATFTDEAFDSDEALRVRRLVYRVSFIVPRGFVVPERRVSAPAGELVVDVTEDRLRARFEGGAGWPVEPDSEVRLRRGFAGVYVFDGEGGRNLPPGGLASWFEGRSGEWSGTRVRVQREFGRRSGGPTELVCALLAEWTSHEREAVLPRCSRGSLPPGFAFGPWRGERTAVVPLQLPRRALRADERDPPTVTAAHHGVWLSESELRRIAPRQPDPKAGGSASLGVTNRSRTRIMVVVQGIPIGWVDPGHSASFEGFRPGRYRVGALRPLGLLRRAPKTMRLPGEIRVGPR